MNEIRLADFRAESLQFAINHNFKANSEQIPLSIQVSQKARMSAKPEEPIFLNLNVAVFDKAEENNYPFTVKASVTGVFFVQAEGSDREALMKDHGMELLLPYARAMISQLVSLANLPTPVILPPMDPSQLQSQPQA